MTKKIHYFTFYTELRTTSVGVNFSMEKPIFLFFFLKGIMIVHDTKAKI